MASYADRLRQALVSDLKAPTMWSTAAFALVGMVSAARAAVAAGLGDVALPAGFVAALAGVAGGLVPPTLTGQVGQPGHHGQHAAQPVPDRRGRHGADSRCGILAGTSTGAANRLMSTVVGALVGLLATMFIPVPPESSPPQHA